MAKVTKVYRLEICLTYEELLSDYEALQHVRHAFSTMPLPGWLKAKIRRFELLREGGD